MVTSLVRCAALQARGNAPVTRSNVVVAAVVTDASEEHQQNLVRLKAGKRRLTLEEELRRVLRCGERDGEPEGEREARLGSFGATCGGGSFFLQSATQHGVRGQARGFGRRTYRGDERIAKPCGIGSGSDAVTAASSDARLSGSEISFASAGTAASVLLSAIGVAAVATAVVVASFVDAGSFEAAGFR